MRDRTTYENNDAALVEAILSGDVSRFGPKSPDRSDRLESWSGIIAHAKSASVRSDDAICRSVMDEIALLDDASQTQTVRRPVATRKFAAALAATLAIGLFASLPFIASNPASAPDRATADATPSATAGSVSASRAPDTMLAGTNFERNARGDFVLKSQMDTGPIRIADAVRFEAVNGKLRIGSL